jgi:hypothetical protein
MAPVATHSGMFGSGDAVHGRDEGAPRVAPNRQNLPCSLGDPVVPAMALTGPLDPAALDPAAVFQAVQQRI